MKNVRLRLKKYRETGNTEWLMDAGNYCMMEFAMPSHRKAHYRPTSKQESPGAFIEKMGRVKGKEEM